MYNLTSSFLSLILFGLKTKYQTRNLQGINFPLFVICVSVCVQYTCLRRVDYNHIYKENHL